jgi:hypothetical protein
MIDNVIDMLAAVLLPIAWAAFQILFVSLIIIIIMALLWRTTVPKD